MPVAQAHNYTGFTYRHLYRLVVLGALDLSLVNLSAVDTLVIDDTGGVADSIVTLPKMGTFRAPLGMRLTLRKASTVAQRVVITPTTDVISSTAGAYPSVGATNVLALPASFQNSVTFEAMSLAAVAGTEDPTVGPTVAGVWMAVDSSTIRI